MHLDPTTWPVWPDLPRTERLVQLAAYHCDVLHVREENRGPWVDRYLAAAGVEPGNPWCAAFVTFLAGVAGYDDLPSHPAAVASWAHWARDTRPIFPVGETSSISSIRAARAIWESCCPPPMAPDRYAPSKGTGGARGTRSRDGNAMRAR